ncbi:hypothetical protein O3W44_00165 [Pantoea sp. LMR881]|uniref:hypothetical protein n=1 Tax=Pantoea sp. LMR881 TaxID=3014336 RepID=UPI0022B0624F|nr:hypothetical protein [Pantoea sp. LMR881]MCZ4057818.1 hypothetical protein [Pantoea sp. LMR881]
MSESIRSRFERLYRSIHGNKFSLVRTHLGYQDAVVDRAFFFWLEGRESAA